MAEEKKNIYEKASATDMSKFIRKRQNLSYISWSDMNAAVRKQFPDFTYKVYENVVSKTEVDEKGNKRTTVYREPFFKTENGNSAWVKIGITLYPGASEAQEIYPILDIRNRPIKAEDVTSADFNKSLQRGLTRLMSRVTLIGSYVYSGEDISYESQESTELQQKCLELIMKKSKTDALKEKVGKVCKEILPEECNGDPRLTTDLDILEKLRRKLVALR